MKIKYRGTKNKYYCDKNEIKFDIDINKIEIIDGGYVVAFKRTKGSMVLFRHIAQIVLMKLLGQTILLRMFILYLLQFIINSMSI